MFLAPRAASPAHHVLPPQTAAQSRAAVNAIHKTERRFHAGDGAPGASFDSRTVAPTIQSPATLKNPGHNYFSARNQLIPKEITQNPHPKNSPHGAN